VADALLEARSLGHRFSDEVWAFRGIDFALGRGELVVLAGRNGAGKTQFAKHLAGLLHPTEGTVLFEGRPLLEYRESPSLRVGYVFQDARLQIVGDRVEEDARFGPENLGIEADTVRERAAAAIMECGLSALRDSFVHTLSGGELRRLALAGILAMQPAAIILDEPFANLDRDGVCSVVRIIYELHREGIALLVVTHELEKILGLADRLAVMEKGAIVLSGRPEATLSAGIEAYGLRDPLRSPRSIKDLAWLD
jgi:biotin transport system ATP-binding protein